MDIQKKVTASLFDERESDEKRPGYDEEMTLYNMVAEGRIDEAMESLSKHPASDDEVRGVLSIDPFRNTMYHFVAMTAIVTRVCISKGMPQDVAYKLSDAYIMKADSQLESGDIHDIQIEMIKTFADFMKDRKEINAKSKQIKLCIDYIRENIHSSITVSELADRLDLNETYLSKLFKKEMGITVSEYIRDEKVEEACWLLRYTDKTSIEIANDLSFSSHSYFISVFKKATTMTPKEYRNEYFRAM